MPSKKPVLKVANNRPGTENIIPRPATPENAVEPPKTPTHVVIEIPKWNRFVMLLQALENKAIGDSFDMIMAPVQLTHIPKK